MKTMGALLFEPGTRSGWVVEEIELNPPKENEALVKLAASGLCHSDDHLDSGDIQIPFAPILGGHEGAGVVMEVGPGVTAVQPGDHCVLSFLPVCGHCRFCTMGESNLCDTSAGVLLGVAPDGTHRIHSRGLGVGAMSYLGTFAPYCVVPVNSIVTIDESVPLDKAALVGCGVPTGWGSAVYAAETRIGDTAAVIGVGGVGINAVQGFRHAGAKNIVAVDPVEFKRQKALELGATHAAATFDEAREILGDITRGVMADRAVFTVGTGDGELVEDSATLIRKGGVLVMTSAAPQQQTHVKLDLYTFAMSGKRLQGTLLGSANPANDIRLLIDLYMKGDLELDELVTRTYRLEEINQGYADMLEGRNLRGLIVYD
jgi:NDMA-dependent alcohol dehydrogenase